MSQDNDNITTTLMGGVTRVTVGSADGDTSEAVKIANQGFRPDATEVTRWDSVTGESVTTSGVARYDGSRDGGWEAKPGILATAQNNAGTPTGDLQRPGVTVLLDPFDPNTRTSIKTAVSTGVLQLDSAGNYRETYNPHAAQYQQQPVQQQAPQQSQQQVHDKSTDGQMAHIIDSVSTNLGSQWNEAAAALIANKPVDVENIARATGYDTAFISASLEHAQATLYARARTAAQSVGLDAASYEDMCRWAERQPGGREAVSELAFGNSVEGVKRMARTYMVEVKPSQSAIKSAGLKTWSDYTGIEMVDVPGYGPMSTAAASKLRLI